MKSHKIRAASVLMAALLFVLSSSAGAAGQAPGTAKTPGPLRRMPDGKPDLQGFYAADAGGANYGLERHPSGPLLQATRGVIIDPPDGKLPVQPWAKAENESRRRAERGYDDPTAHCFLGGVPRSLYVPSPFQIIQTANHVIFLHERMSWRTVALDGRTHLPDVMRLWMGDSVGHWEADTLVVETTNFNGKTWLNEVGEIVSHAEHVVERFTPVDSDTINYRATIDDPIVYTRPWTIAMPLQRQQGELLEVACREDDQDLPHLKEIRDRARAAAKDQGAK